MNIKKETTKDHFEILRKIGKKPESSQRQLAEELGFSLGKLNYCLKELKHKGLTVDSSGGNTHTIMVHYTIEEV